MKGQTAEQSRRRAEVAIANRHGPEIARSVLDIIDEVGLAVYVRRLPRDRKTTIDPHVATPRRPNSDRAAEDPSFRRRLRDDAHAHAARVQEVTRRDAQHHAEPWSGPELEIAVRPNLSASEAARMLGRSYYAVRNMRRKIAADPRKYLVVGVRREAS